MAVWLWANHCFPEPPFPLKEEEIKDKYSGPALDSPCELGCTPLPLNVVSLSDEEVQGSGLKPV